MMMLFSAVLGAMGLVSIVSRKSLLGVLVGVQLLVLGAGVAFVLSGISSEGRNEGHVFALFVVLGGVAQLVTGFAFAIRLYYLKRSIRMDHLRSLRQ